MTKPSDMNASPEKQYVDLFRQARTMLARHSSPVMDAVRDEAFSFFEAKGFPSPKDEGYKYTDLRPKFAIDYGMNLNRLDVKVDPYKTFRCDVPNLSTSLFFVVNDTFCARHEHLTALPAGVEIMSLREAAAKHPSLLAAHYDKLAGQSQDSLTAFNTAFAEDGVFLYVPDNVVVEKPIQLINVMSANVDMMANRRMLIIIGENAQAKFLVCDHADGEVNYLSTQVVEIFVGRNAVFDYYELEETTAANTRVASTYVRQEASSNVLVNGVTLTNGTTRNHVTVMLEGENAEIMLGGIATVDRRQHIDNNTLIDHRVPRCTSNELFKYVLDDEAVGAFAGKVRVNPGAQKTSSQQTNKNLCLTKQARMYAQPQLEIYADDVKCSHGATVGQLDENAVFYMRQRGLSKKEAMNLLMFAFVNEVVDNIRMDALKDRLHLLVEKRFRGELDRCGGCTKCKYE